MLIDAASRYIFAFLMQVKIVLRDRESGQYYLSHLQWVTNPYDALTFRNILEAEEFCRTHGLQYLQLIQQSGYFPRPLRYAAAKSKASRSLMRADSVPTAN